MTLSQPNMNEHSIEWIPKKFVFFGIKSLVLRQSKNPSQISSVTARINVPNVIICIVRVWHRWNAYIKNKKMIIGVCWYIFSLLLLCVLFSHAAKLNVKREYNKKSKNPEFTISQRGNLGKYYSHCIVFKTYSSCIDISLHCVRHSDLVNSLTLNGSLTNSNKL